MLTEAMKEFAEHFPGLVRPLIQERDEYMVFMLRLLASRSARGALPAWPHAVLYVLFTRIKQALALPMQQASCPWVNL